MQRRFELDWLRVLLFALLVLHHVAVGFIPIGADIYGFANNDLGGELLNLFIYFNHTWRLPTLFLISGIGTYFATRRTAGARYLRQRIAQLLAPALFGTFVLNATYGYAIAWTTGETPGSYLAFWADWITRPEPTQVGHLWFLYNLVIYTLICWPLYKGRNHLERLKTSVFLQLSLMVAGATLIMIVSKPYMSAIAGDGYQFPWYLWVFACGYVIGSQHQAFLPWLAQRAWLLMLGGIVLFVCEVVILAIQLYISPEAGLALAQGGWAAEGIKPPFDPLYVLFTVVSGINTWFWCLTFFGLAARYLHRPSPALRFLNPAVFPVYVLHFPITIIGLALLAELPWPWQLKFFLLAIVVYALSALLYLAARRTGRFIYLIGGKARDRQEAYSQGPV